MFYSPDGASGWSEVSKLVASDAGNGDNFGYSVSVWGNVMVIGARYDDTALGSNTG